MSPFRNQLISFETRYHWVVKSILLPKYNIKKYCEILKNINLTIFYGIIMYYKKTFTNFAKQKICYNV